MGEVRRATAEDAEVIAEHRRAMFVDAGFAESAALDEMVARFAEWVRPRIADGSYVGWLLEDEGAVVAGAGLWVMEFPPHWIHVEARRAYLLNFYTAPTHRGRGIAPRMLRTAVDEARSRGISVVTLHASKFGRPIYEKHGFVQTDEMMLRGEMAGG